MSPRKIKSIPRLMTKRASTSLGARKNATSRGVTIAVKISASAVSPSHGAINTDERGSIRYLPALTAAMWCFSTLMGLLTLARRFSILVSMKLELDLRLALVSARCILPGASVAEFLGTAPSPALTPQLASAAIRFLSMLRSCRCLAVWMPPTAFFALCVPRPDPVAAATVVMRSREAGQVASRANAW